MNRKPIEAQNDLLNAQRRNINQAQSINELVEQHKRLHLSQSDCAIQPTKLLIDNRITFTVTETAFYLGVSTKSITRAIERKELFAKKLGGRWLIPKSAIESWLNRKE